MGKKRSHEHGSYNSEAQKKLKVAGFEGSHALTKYNGHPSTLPPLPPILDESLAKIAFVSPDTISGPISSKLNTSYDRLEFLGDAYIEVIATRLVYSRFPELPAGRCSQQRELLVKNETLAQYALAYQFDKKALLPPDLKATGGRKVWIKTMGDIFEAYVAAVILSDPSNGLLRAEEWLTALWENKLSNQSSHESQVTDPMAKQKLATKVKLRDVKLDYREERPPHPIKKEGKLLYYIGVYMTGWGYEDMRLGEGTALNKVDAGARAATEALENPITDSVAVMKKEFVAKVALEREKQMEVQEKEEFKDSNDINEVQDA